MKELLNELFDKEQREVPPPAATTTAEQLASIDRRLRSIEKLISKSNKELGCITGFLWLLVGLAALGFILWLA